MERERVKRSYVAINGGGICERCPKVDGQPKFWPRIRGHWRHNPTHHPDEVIEGNEEEIGDAINEQLNDGEFEHQMMDMDDGPVDDDSVLTDDTNALYQAMKALQNTCNT